MHIRGITTARGQRKGPSAFWWSEHKAIGGGGWTAVSLVVAFQERARCIPEGMQERLPAPSEDTISYP